MQKQNKLLLIFSNLALLAISYYSFYLLSRPISQDNKLIAVSGIQYIPEADILNLIDLASIGDFNHFNLPRIDIEEQVASNPLVNRIKIRSKLFPVNQIQINTEEIYPLMFQEVGNSEISIFDDQGEAYLRTKAELEYISKIHGPRLIPQIFSPESFINKENLQILSEILNFIEASMSSINIDESIQTIYSSPEGDFSMQGKFYEYRIGELNKKTLKKIQRMRLVLNKIQELQEQGTKLKYIDLSLKSNDIILGKHYG